MLKNYILKLNYVNPFFNITAELNIFLKLKLSKESDVFIIYHVAN